MKRLYKSLGLIILIVGLSACGGPDTETAPPPQDATDEEETIMRSEPGEAPPVGDDLTLDSPAEADAVEQARAQREQLREQRAGDRHWWADDALAERLGLDPDQRSALLEAREALHRARIEGRERMRAQRELQRQADTAGDHERLEELQAQTNRLREQMNAAEQAWQEDLRAVLHPEQIERLAEEQPELVQPPADR